MANIEFLNSEVVSTKAEVNTLINDVKTSVTSISNNIGDADSGLVKGVADVTATATTLSSDLNTADTGIKAVVAANVVAIGDADSGLVKGVADVTATAATNKDAIGDADSGLVKGVADNAALIAKVTGTDNTDNRPAADSVVAGTMYFDTALVKPIWSTSEKWVYADGTDV